MRSTELHGERRGWNLNLEGRVVRFGWIFLEVWIFRNVRDEFQNFVTDHFSAAPAKREDGIPHQKHAGARFVLMAYLINSRVLNQLSRNQRAIALIICCDVGVLQFHKCACICSFRSAPQARRAAATRPSEMGCVQGSHKLVLRVMREEVLLFSFQATLRRISVAGKCDKGFHRPRDERLIRYQI